jgi:hypothetical protein
MASDNIYNQPGAAKVYLTLANQTEDVLADDMGKCKLALGTDTSLLNYTDENGNKYRVAAYVTGMIILTPNFAMFEDGDGNLGVYKLIGGVWTDTGNRLA